MISNRKFWISMAVFQVLFALVIFVTTRDYYLRKANPVSGHPATMSSPALDWQSGINETGIAQLSTSAFSDSAIQDPAEISRRADEFFTNGQYERAANAYERLLTFDSKNVEVHNNLGLTLHYLGRSGEALRRLDEGIALDPNNQRIWLTLGFVNSQLGNIQQARTALTKATQIGSDPSIRQAANKMLESLP